MHWRSSSIANASTASREKPSPKSTPRSSSSRLIGWSASPSTSWARSMREVRKTSGASPREHVGQGGLVVGPGGQLDLAGRGGGVVGVDDRPGRRRPPRRCLDAEGRPRRLLGRRRACRCSATCVGSGRRPRRHAVQARDPSCSATAERRRQESTRRHGPTTPAETLVRAAHGWKRAATTAVEDLSSARLPRGGRRRARGGSAGPGAPRSADAAESQPPVPMSIQCRPYRASSSASRSWSWLLSISPAQPPSPVPGGRGPAPGGPCPGSGRPRRAPRPTRPRRGRARRRLGRVRRRPAAV